MRVAPAAVQERTGLRKLWIFDENATLPPDIDRDKLAIEIKVALVKQGKRVEQIDMLTIFQSSMFDLNPPLSRFWALAGYDRGWLWFSEEPMPLLRMRLDAFRPFLCSCLFVVVFSAFGAFAKFSVGAWLGLFPAVLFFGQLYAMPSVRVRPWLRRLAGNARNV